jgi:hypothetical protein
MIDHLDRITNLGFDVNLTWNKSIEITYYLEDNPNPNELDIRVLYCMTHFLNLLLEIYLKPLVISFICGIIET